MNCAYCAAPLPASSRRDRQYCTNTCSALASYYRRKAGRLPPPKWQHPALLSSDPVLRAAAMHAQQLGKAHRWVRSSTRWVLDGLTTVLARVLRPPPFDTPRPGGRPESRTNRK